MEACGGPEAGLRGCVASRGLGLSKSWVPTFSEDAQVLPDWRRILSKRSRLANGESANQSPRPSLPGGHTRGLPQMRLQESPSWRIHCLYLPATRALTSKLTPARVRRLPWRSESARAALGSQFARPRGACRCPHGQGPDIQRSLPQSKAATTGDC